EPIGPTEAGHVAMTGVPERIAARRAAQRRRRRRRRLTAFGVLALSVLAGALLVTARFGADDVGPGGEQAAAADNLPGGSAGAGIGTAPAPLRNATAQPGWRPWHGPVPILMYHVIDDPAPDAPFPDLYLAPADFRSQVEWLVERGYEA